MNRVDDRIPTSLATTGGCLRDRSMSPPRHRNADMATAACHAVRRSLHAALAQVIARITATERPGSLRNCGYAPHVSRQLLKLDGDRDQVERSDLHRGVNARV